MKNGSIFIKLRGACCGLLAAAVLSGCLAIPAFSAEKARQYHYLEWGLSFSVPEELAEDLRIEEYEDRLDLIYTPAAESSGPRGCVFSIERVAPKGEYYEKLWHPDNVSVIAAGTDAYYVRTRVGGADASREKLADYITYSERLSKAIMATIEVTNGEKLPALNTDRFMTAIAACKDGFDRGTLAMELYQSLDIGGETFYECDYGDISAADECAEAVGYLTHIGVLCGDPDGNFRGNDPVTRAEFAAIIRRALLIPTPIWYGDEIHYNDVTNQHWAWNELNRACKEGLLTGDASGRLRPDAPITLNEAKNLLSNMQAGSD